MSLFSSFRSVRSMNEITQVWLRSQENHTQKIAVIVEGIRPYETHTPNVRVNSHILHLNPNNCHAPQPKATSSLTSPKQAYNTSFTTCITGVCNQESRWKVLIPVDRILVSLLQKIQGSTSELTKQNAHSFFKGVHLPSQRAIILLQMTKCASLSSLVFIGMPLFS